jgi:hypothetical protein
MALKHAYAVTNLLSGLAAASFTWSNSATTNRGYLNDAEMESQFSAGSASSSLSVVVDLGTATSVSCVAILNSTLGSATAPTVTITGADNAAISTNAVVVKSASTPYAVAPRSKDHVFQFASTSKRYWKVAFTWTGAHTLKIGELFFAVQTQLTRAAALGDGRGESLEHVANVLTMGTGTKRSHFLAGPYRKKTIPLADLSASDLAEVTALVVAAFGPVTPILWIEQYEATSSAAAAANQDCIYGKLEAAEWGYEEPDFNLYDIDALVIRSLGREVGA